ncbi:MAG: hypothetical protein V3T58_08320 [Candidatus Hydrothermarchaeales archaeon]
MDEHKSTKEGHQMGHDHNHMQHMLLMLGIFVVVDLLSRGGQERTFGYTIIVLAPLVYILMRGMFKEGGKH